MELIIHGGRRLFEVQIEFQKFCPNLKIEFYTQKHKVREGSNKKDIMNNELFLGEIRDGHSGHFNIHKEMKVSELETAFEEIFGLSVQVFRKSEGIWIQTTASDSWTLDEQNKDAAEHNTFVEEIIDSMDQQDLE
jgi:hypothetical protein